MRGIYIEEEMVLTGEKIQEEGGGSNEICFDQHLVNLRNSNLIAHRANLGICGKECWLLILFVRK